MASQTPSYGQILSLSYPRTRYLGGSPTVVIETLTQVKGIGRWTAEMFLIFGLNRPDVLPVADLGIKDALKRYFVLSEHPKPNECEKLTQAWRPYRSVAMWYLWRLSE